MKINIFISYSSENANKMNALKRAILKSEMLAPIVVADKRSPKKSLADKVRGAILESDYLVPILTESSINNQWVNQEIGFAEALGTKIKIFPIVEKAIFNDLKGFIHSNLELPYQYAPSENKSKEASSFRKSYQLLLEDIAHFEEIRDDPSLASIKNLLQKINTTEYRSIDVSLDNKITERTTYHLRVKLSSAQQFFKTYYLIETDQKERRWVGYKNDLALDFVRPDEFTKTVKNNDSINYSINEKVIKTIKDRFADLKGKPSRIKSVRFRGDKKSDEIIRYYYAFSE